MSPALSSSGRSTKTASKSTFDLDPIRAGIRKSLFSSLDSSPVLFYLNTRIKSQTLELQLSLIAGGFFRGTAYLDWPAEEEDVKTNIGTI